MIVLSCSPTLGERPEIHFVFLVQIYNKFRFLFFLHSTMYIGTLVADTYLYQFYFWRDPCSSMKPGVHTVGRSVGRRALLFTVCSLQNAIFTAVAGKKQNCKSCWKKRFSNVSSSLQLHCFRRTMIIDCQKWNVLKVRSPVPYQCDYYMRKCNLSRKRRTNIQFCGM